MKKWIHPVSLYDLLSQYEPIQLEYVLDCYVDVLDDMRDQVEFYDATTEEEASVNAELIKEDYLIGADDYDLDRQLFDHIYSIFVGLDPSDIKRLIESL